MIKDYLIVKTDVLPDFFEKVLQARMLLESGQCESVSDAIKVVGISRSTYYKYKDTVFSPSEERGRRFTLSMFLSDQTGVLSDILNCLSSHETNIITIHQDIPINHMAIVIITLDGRNLDIPIDDLRQELKTIDGVCKVRLIAME